MRPSVTLLNDLVETTAPDGLMSSTLNSGGFAIPPPSRSVTPVTPTRTLNGLALKFETVNEIVLLDLTGMISGAALDGFGLAVASICAGTDRAEIDPKL